MANFSAADVKRLRELTGAGMLDCKKALEESEGDFDKAVEILRLKGAKDVGKRESRTASNGLVAIRLEGAPASKGAILELNCETDFVAKGERFQQLAGQLVDLVFEGEPADVAALLETETGGRAVKDLADEAAAALGEKLEVRRFAVLKGGSLASYLHRTDPALPPAVGVLVQLDQPNAEVGKDIAMHVAASPATRYLSRDEVPAELVETERRLAEQMARDEGKPEAALSKIVEGRVNSYFKDVALLEQAWVKDPKTTIRKLLDNAGVAVTGFVRYKVGQS
ncbi:MAG: translation elongation factor Ts [Mycobacteriales bacterium]